MSSKRRRFSRERKAKIALEALWGDRTLPEIASKHQVHPNQVGAWKRQAVEGLAEGNCQSNWRGCGLTGADCEFGRRVAAVRPKRQRGGS